MGNEDKKYCSNQCEYFDVKADCVICRKYEYCEVDREVINGATDVLCVDSISDKKNTNMKCI